MHPKKEKYFAVVIRLQIYKSEMYPPLNNRTDRQIGVQLSKAEKYFMSDVNTWIIEPLTKFVKDSTYLVKKCTKPDHKGFKG